MPVIILMDTIAPETIMQKHAPAYALMKRGKRGAAELIAKNCEALDAAASTQRHDDIGNPPALKRCDLLDNLLDILLNPYEAIGDWNNIDWLRWLMAGGKTIDEFNSAVKDYDYGTCCGLVWTANYVAYRCRTCSISPCMSLCGDCFKRGDHTGHDFNMFRSQAGGACDCGDTSVMKPEGFCRKHSTNNIDGSASSNATVTSKQPPADLLRVAERIVPRLLLRLVNYLRENSKNVEAKATNSLLPVIVGGIPTVVNQPPPTVTLKELDTFLGMLHDLSALGAAMRRVMTVSLTNEKIYRWACDYYNTIDSPPNQETATPTTNIYTIYTDKVRRYYAEAVFQYTSSMSTSRQRSLSNSEDDEDDDEGDWPIGVQNKIGNRKRLDHSTFLQEIVFWTVRYEFPQKMVCLLLHMLPDATYKEALTEAFVMHYGCVAHVLATTRDSDTLSNHIVHISVQLFSNEALATRMVDKLGLLRIMVTSLRRMMNKILIPSTLYDTTKNKHKVVDCSKAVMKEHCYWPLVSDLNNVLSHRPIAVKFMQDIHLLDSWFSYLSMFQGMNVNCQELGGHVEFEPNTYYAAFSAELEASAYPMWAMLSHLTSSETWPLASHVLRSCLRRLLKWLTDVGCYNNQLFHEAVGSAVTSAEYNVNNLTNIASIRKLDDRHQFTFHLPLHRYLAVFLCQAVRAQGARIEDVIPYSNTGDTSSRDSLLLAIAAHPVRAQAAFYEIMQGAWVRNGLQIKGQAMTYIQSNFCISMVDADIYLLQLCLSELSDPNILMSLIFEKFKVYDWTNSKMLGGLPQIMASPEFDVGSCLESLFVFLSTLIGVRTNLCSDADYDYCQSQLEMVTLLCVSDKTHSQLMELMPERCGSGTQGAASSASTRGNTVSQNIESLGQKSPPSPRDFETVLQAVAEYKRPQFEASGNMQQGLYVPLAHVWRDLYDPVHVLLRAVHRRDFQSSMDRYTAFMRTVGSLRPNETPWPPFRTPQKHHPAYRDPRRALLTKLFQSVAWLCLYRAAVYRDVNEQTLSLLIHLLDQAWICNGSDGNVSNTTTNLHQPMDVDQQTMDSKIKTDEDKFPKQKIIMKSSDYRADDDGPLLLDRWFDNNDFVQNVCTTITHIETPPSFLNYYFGQPDDNETTNMSQMATNLFDYFTSSVAAATSAATSFSPMALNPNFEPAPSQDSGPSTITVNEIPESALAKIKHQLRSLQQNTDSEDYHIPDIPDDDETQNSVCAINESIISLLLRLHSDLSGKPDSYQPPTLTQTTTFGIVNDEMSEKNYISGASNVVNDHLQEEPQPCGDGPFYVSRLLDRMARGSSLCYECIVYTRYKLWPKSVVLRETATRENEEREKRERKRRARDKQQQMMEEMARAQRAFLESARLSGDLDSSGPSPEMHSPSTSIPSPINNTTSNMECEEPTVDLSTVTPSGSGSASLSNVTIDMDENSCSSNSITKESGAKIIGLQNESTLTVDCVICNQTVPVNAEQQHKDAIGLVILIQGTSILAHRRHILNQPLKTENLNYLDRTDDSYLNNDGVNNCIDEEEHNYYHYWPTLPPSQQRMQLFMPTDNISDSQQNHQPKIDDNDTTTYASHSDRRTRLMTQYFNNLEKADIEIGAVTTTTSTSPIGGNLQVQTCGHHLHLRCWSSYLSSLRGAQRFNSDRGEYSCPLCRQLANSLLPLLPVQEHEVSFRPGSCTNVMAQTMTEISKLINRQQCESMVVMVPSENDPNAESSNSATSTNENSAEKLPDPDERIVVEEEIGSDSGDEEYFEIVEDQIYNFINKCVCDMVVKAVVTPAAQRDKRFKVKWHNVISIAWTNIQVELIQRNNTLMDQTRQEWSPTNQKLSATTNITNTDGNGSSNNYYNMLPKRNCMTPLLKDLGVTARALLAKQQTKTYNPLSDIWYKLVGLDAPKHCYSAQPPLLLRDPCSILLQMVLLLPNVDNDMFDTLVRLAYNMQVYSSALKVAITWPHDCNYNRQLRQSYKKRGRCKINKSTDTTNKIGSENCGFNKMDIDESFFEDDDTSVLFSQAVSLAKTIVFLSQDDIHVEEDIDDDADDQEVIENPIASISEDEDKNMLLLETYGRQCTLPFLRFAALLKNYTYYGDNHYNLDVKGESKTISPLQQQQPQSNLNVDHGNREEFVDRETLRLDQFMKHSRPAKYSCWSRDDYEFLLLAQYLKLLNTTNECDGKSYNSCEEKIDSNVSSVDIRQSLQPPSAMEAVIWPQWSYSNTGVDHHASTKISRAWLIAFREALLIPRNTVIAQNMSTTISSTAAKFDPNSNATTTTNILMAARLLFAVDCCDSSGTTADGLILKNILPMINWMGPRLVRLPHLYDDVFQYYHGKACHRCLGVPRETSVCLLCGTVVCLKENCCTSSGVFEAVQHSLECGGGTSMFLVVTSSSVVVIRGKRACLWGSVYLDAFGEEDRELKRGKPLFLSAERYRLLERQWLAHRFDHTNKKWVWHRDAL